MTELTTTELAEKLGVSKGRVSQYVREGKLSGCYRGDGRQRRFDLDASARALGRGLDKGQMLGNGLETRRSLRRIEAGAAEEPPPVPQKAAGTKRATEVEPDRLEIATIINKEEDARRKRRDNERDEGRWVLASEVQSNVARAMAQEIAEFESAIRDGARAVADEFGVDFREARKIMMDQWRAHRELRMKHADEAAAAAEMTGPEQEADV